MRGKKLKLLRLTLVVEYFDRFQPARLRGTVQFPEITQSPLLRTIRSPHGLHQRPVSMVLTILLPTVGTQKHSRPILSRERNPFKRVGLHYIDFSEFEIAGKQLASPRNRTTAQIDGVVTNFG